jgi:8-oxo-dGTP pyrophosphatase MutT (NUDIX family)
MIILDNQGNIDLTKLNIKKKAIFAVFYTKEKVKLFNNLNDPFVKSCIKEIEGYQFILCFRHDNRLGFIGGTIENNENEKETLLREIKEETPGFFEIVKPKIENDDYKKVYSYYDKKQFLVIYYLIPFSQDEMLKLKEKIPYSLTSEITGINFVNVYDKETHLKLFGKKFKEKGIYSLLKSNQIIDKEIIKFLINEIFKIKL